jgi:nitroreductase
VTAREAALRRRSRSSVTGDAPSHDDVLGFVTAASTVADHSALHPWRVIEIRGEARERVGAAIAASQGLSGHDAEKASRKPLRASLLLAVVSSPIPSRKVPEWEQEAVASGVAHLLSLLLDEAGWGVMWRTGLATRAPEVHAAHGLREGENLLGWLYVGGIEPGKADKPRKLVDVREFVSTL